jgi:hypothetical protein
MEKAILPKREFTSSADFFTICRREKVAESGAG